MDIYGVAHELVNVDAADVEAAAPAVAAVLVPLAAAVPPAVEVEEAGLEVDPFCDGDGLIEPEHSRIGFVHADGVNEGTVFAADGIDAGAGEAEYVVQEEIGIAIVLKVHSIQDDIRIGRADPLGAGTDVESADVGLAGASAGRA